MSELSELIKINKNIEAQNEEIIRLLKKIVGEDGNVSAPVQNVMKPFPEHPFDFDTLGYDDLIDEEEVEEEEEITEPHFDVPLDVGEVYLMEDKNPYKISIKNNETIIDNLNTLAGPKDYYLAELVANELMKNNSSFEVSTVILPESVIGNLPKTLERCIGEGAKKVYGPWKAMMELLNAPDYLQHELQLDFYKSEEHLIERVFKEMESE
jgi:hypothetical protein